MGSVDRGILKLERGQVNSQSCSILRDTGATICGVRRSLIAKKQFTGGSVTCRMFGGELRHYPLARVQVCTPYIIGELLCAVLEDPIADWY